MRVICSPRRIVDYDRPGQGVGDIAGAGFAELVMDLSWACKEDDLEKVGKRSFRENFHTELILYPERMDAHMRPMIDRCKGRNLAFPVAVAPYLKRTTKQLGLNDLLKTLAEESIRLCGAVKCEYLIVRPLVAGIESDQLWSVNRDFYLHLSELAKEQHVKILLENQCKNVSGHMVRGICADYGEAAAWVDQLNELAGEERFGFCLNVGTCMLYGQNMYDMVAGLGERLKVVILRECDDDNEKSWLPFSVTQSGPPDTKWLNLIRGLRAIAFDGSLVIEMGDTAGAFSPILRPQLMALAKAVGDYFEWQIGLESLLKKYDSRVLFGAGNMCRSYMKNFGEAYRPLFTCDNNPALWGQEFEGLEIRDPKCLKDLPEDTAIFICNIYYREIEEQIRGMGLKNPVEFFNDEYMPSFHFDRIDATTRRSDKEA